MIDLNRYKNLTPEQTWGIMKIKIFNGKVPESIETTMQQGFQLANNEHEKWVILQEFIIAINEKAS